MSTPSKVLQPYQIELIEQAMTAGALKFGTFTLKSGRVSPYFFNASFLSSGPVLSCLSKAYASTIVSALNATDALPQFDVLFGPAYKGIPFAACTSLVLHTSHNIAVGFAYDRKEVKDHGEGGKMVGIPVKGQRVVIIDDVMTAGTAVRAAIQLVKQEGGDVVGVVQCLDREEVGRDGVSSTVKELEEEIGKGRVQSILKMRDLILWLEKNEMEDELKSLLEYRDQFGVKG
jgi:orotate phosphoribosyltransferase